MAHAAAYGRTLVQCDVVTAYLKAPLWKEIYVEIPKGYNDDPTKVWRLHKCLYGLKQSAREWNNTLAGIVIGALLTLAPVFGLLFRRRISW